MIRLALLLLLQLGAFQKPYKPKVEVIPGAPVKQPIAYSHKTHVAAGLTCTGCHTMPGEGFLATYPKEAFCMGCHQTVKADSPEIQKLAQFAKDKKPVPWLRVYQLPDIIYFNHALHAKEMKIGCHECHGDVAQREVLFQEKSILMQSCMDCHAQRKASNSCDTCHATQ